MSALSPISVVLPNCRDHITAEDIDFITSVLCADTRQVQFLVDLLTDEHARDVILDDTHLLNAIQDRPGCLKISCYLYFYLIVRDTLRRIDVDDCRLADYVAEMLAEYSHAARVTRPMPDGSVRSQYMVDMIGALRSKNGQERFQIRAHIGNFALFMAGLYPERILYRQEHHGAPGLDYYENVGSASYEMASHLHLAEELELAPLLEKLSGLFHPVRVALNQARERFLFTDAQDQHLLLLPAAE